MPGGKHNGHHGNRGSVSQSQGEDYSTTEAAEQDALFKLSFLESLDDPQVSTKLTQIMKSANQDLTQSFRSLRDEVHSLRQQLSDRDAAIAGMKHDIQELRDQNAALKQSDRDRMLRKQDMEDETGDTEDSDVILPPSLSRMPSANALGNPDTVVVTIWHLELNKGTYVMENNAIKMLFVAYRLCGIDLQETETPRSLPKPAPNREITFNFRKVFRVDQKNNLERRQILASMLLPDDPDQGKVRFTVVSEPPEDEDDAECEDVGVAFISLVDILDRGKDVIKQDLPIYGIRDEETEIGVIRLSLECLAALQAVQQEMAQAQPEMD